MGLAYIDRYSRFTRIRTIYDLLTKSVNSVFAENFIDYLSNSETTWGSPKTVILLEVSEFKKHLKKFVKTSEHCTYMNFAKIWPSVAKKIDINKYVIIK